MVKSETNRRDFLKVFGMAVAVESACTALARGQSFDVLEIAMVRAYRQGRFYYDPIGLYVERGQTVRWTTRPPSFSVVAFHPDNDNHELRIPDGAEPFDSKILGRSPSFEWTFEVEGTYDYFSWNHEAIGMIGRIIVGAPGGPGEQAPGYGGREGRRPILYEARQTFEHINSEQIVQEKAVPYPMESLRRRYPLY
jgi:plastocyanin